MKILLFKNWTRPYLFISQACFNIMVEIKDYRVENPAAIQVGLNGSIGKPYQTPLNLKIQHLCCHL